ncbi:hypothetical protein UCRPC4_g01984 [Phaeomoniella chlamydospora]|uniref:Uncharacterized protein n=1 Tax=Phaeomoniella chlamydospora TaxID=158046 RepID=A0A0G2GP70_PHACM|nr:hypothetical protein UCRPC4_g01984 [Phaeomoniella chlamydospora]
MSGPAPFQRNFSELVEKMKKQDTLNGWDVLVTYDETQVNAALAERFAALQFNQSMHLTKNYTSLETGEEVTILIDFVLTNPTLRIQDTFGACQAIFSISGSYTFQKTGRTTQLPNNLVLIVTTSLATVKGVCAVDGQFTPTPDPKDKTGKPPNWVEILEPGASVAQGICLNFAGCKATIADASGDPLSEGLRNLNAVIRDKIEERFSDNAGLKWYLAAVNNTYDTSKTNAAVLQPTSFCFTVMPGAGTTPASLLMWIAVKGGKANGTMSSAGISFGFKFTSHTISVPERKQDPWCNYHLDGVSCDVSTQTSTLSVVNNRALVAPATPSFQVSYASESKRLNWKYDWMETRPKGGVRHHEEGQCDVVFDFKGYGQWADKSTASRPNMLGLKFNFDSLVHSTITPVKMDSGFQKWWSGFSNKVPPGYENLTAPAPNMDLELAPLDYFLTTNLLFPGQHIFQADPPVAASDSSNTGIATPRDTILTGKLVTHAESKQLNATQMANFAAHIQTSDRHAETSADLLGTELDASTDDSVAGKGWASFREDIMSFPKTNLLTDIIHTFSSSENIDERLKQLLARYGYSDLEEFDFFSLLGTSVDRVFSRVQDEEAEVVPNGDNSTDNNSTGNAVELSGTPLKEPDVPPEESIDIRTFGGVYIIEEPAEDAGKRLFIDPVTSKIGFSGRTTTPTQNFDKDSGKVTVHWKQADRSCSVVFDVWVDPVDINLNVTFTGTTTSTTDSSKSPRFTGKLLQAKSDSKEANDSVNGPEKAMVKAVSDGMDSATVFGIVSGAIGLAVCIGQCAWPCIRKKLPNKCKRFLDKCNVYFQEQNTVIAEHVEIVVVRHEDVAHEENRSLIEKELEQEELKQREAINDELKKHDPKDREALKQGDLLWAQCQQQVEKNIGLKLETLDTGLTNDAIRDVLKDFERTQVIDTKTKDKIQDTVVKTRLETTKTSFKDADYYASVTEVAIYKSQLDLQKANHGTAQQKVNAINDMLQQTEKEMSQAKTKIEVKEKEIEEATNNGDPTDALEEDMKILKKELEDLVKQKKTQDQDKKDRDHEEQKAKEKVDESEKQHKDAHKKAEDARRKAIE